MTYRYSIRFLSFSRGLGLYERRISVRGHNWEEAVQKFRQKYGNINIKSVDGVPFDEIVEGDFSWNAAKNP